MNIDPLPCNMCRAISGQSPYLARSEREAHEFLPHRLAEELRHVGNLALLGSLPGEYVQSAKVVVDAIAADVLNKILPCFR